MRHPKWYDIAKRAVGGFALLVGLGACSSSGSDPSEPPNVSVQSAAIIGGSTAATDAWPWSVKVYYGGKLRCGGSLIAPEWVLSVGHCLNQQPAGYSVQLNNGTMVPASAVMFNPNFSYDGPPTGHSDVGLIRLASPVEVSASVNFIRPAVDGDDPGTNAVAIGWGYTDGRETSLPNTLQQVTLPIVSSTACGSINPARSTVYPDELCAGDLNGTKGVCYGDSGSALIVQRASGTWEHVGMPSVVENDLFAPWPAPMYCISYAVFSRTTAMVNWIRQYVPDPAWLPGLDLVSM